MTARKKDEKLLSIFSERERVTDRQRAGNIYERDKDISETDRHTETEKQTETKTERQTNRQKETDRDRDTLGDRETEMEVSHGQTEIVISEREREREGGGEEREID